MARTSALRAPAPVPMRVLQLCPAMHREGTWFRTFFLSRALARRGHDVTLVKVSASARLRTVRSEEDGVHLVETPRFVGGRFSHHGTRLPSDVLARVLHVTRERYEIVHAYAHHLNVMLPGLVARHVLRRGTLVMDWDDLWSEGGIYGEKPARGWLERSSLAFAHWSEVRLKRYADAVTVVSEDLRERSIRAGVPADRITFIPNGAAVDTFRPMPRAQLRRALGLPLDLPMLLFSGYARFDLEFMLDAVALLRRRGVPHLTVITGPHEDQTRALARARGLEEHVRVAGIVPLDELARYLAAADVGLIPYADKPLNRARWPIKLGDYLAAGLPIATCDVGEMGRVVPEWKVGAASAPDPEAFSTAIERLLRDPALPAVAERARARAEALSWENIAAELEKVYEAAARRRGPATP